MQVKITVLGNGYIKQLPNIPEFIHQILQVDHIRHLDQRLLG